VWFNWTLGMVLPGSACGCGKDADPDMSCLRASGSLRNCP